MRAILVASCVMLTLTSHQTGADPYSIALAKYVAGHDDAASDALAHVQAKDIQEAINTSVAMARSSGVLGDSLMFPVLRRLEAMAMLHTEYVLFGENAMDAVFQIAMAHRSLTISRSLVEPASAGHVQTSLVEGAEIRRAREFLRHWYALAASALACTGTVHDG